MRQNDFRLDRLVGFDFHEKTIGVVGTGKIGGAFTRIMHGFGCTLLGYDIEQHQALIEATNITYTSLEELCGQSDVISVNCPLNVYTKSMFNTNTFSKMKKGVMFINTARGGVVNTNDLMDAMDNGTAASAGLDVYEYEKPIFFYDHTDKELEDKLFEKIRSYPNVLITGHQAFLTQEALKGIASTTIANLDVWEGNGISENEL